MKPARTEAVCADIVDHYYSTIDPLGMKAQVVVFDRAACVAYHKQLTCWISGTRRVIPWTRLQS